MSKTVITWGRMNPPTVGHQKLVDKVKAEAKKRGAMPHVYITHTQDKKKNPLDYNTKYKIARKAFGTSVTKSNSKTIIQVMQELEKMGHTEVTLVVGSDRLNEFKTFLNRYNGKDFKFDKLEIVSAGDRDPDAEGVSGMSASKMRAAAQSGDYDSFKKGTPRSMSEKEKKDMYDKIRSVMGATNEAIEWDETDFDFTDEELDAFIEMTDLEELDEDLEIDEEFEEYIEEVRKPLTIQQRMQIARRMKRLAPRMARMRKIRAKRMADPKRLERRSRKAAIKILRKRFAGKQGANYASLSPGAKMSVDRILQKKMALIGRLSKRIMPKVRKAEMERLKRARGGSAAPNLSPKPLIKKESVEKVEMILTEESVNVNTRLMAMLRVGIPDTTQRNLIIRALRGGKDALKNPYLRPYLMNLLIRLVDVTQSDPNIYNKVKERMRVMGLEDPILPTTVDTGQIKEAQDPDIKDRPGAQPAGYHRGLSKSTKIARDRHFKKYEEKPEDKGKKDKQSNYKPAPGDARAKTKPSVHTQKYKAMYGEGLDAAFNNFMAEQYIEEKAIEGLKKKAEKSGIPYGILKTVYDRGMAAWKSGHRPGATPQQWAFARVNSFITKGSGTWGKADKDLAAKVRKEEVQNEDAVANARAAIKREKEADKRKHDAMLDRARLQKAQTKNRATESIDEKFESMLSESFVAGISDTMYAKDFEEHKVHGGFALHPSVMEQGGAGEEGTTKLVKKYKKDTPGEISEAIEFMKKHDIDIVENIYRPLSEKYFEFFREARRMMQEGEMEFSGLDKQILETDLGEFDWYEDMEVPLDCPMVAIEDTIDEKMYYAIATKSAKSKSGWRRVPDTRFDTKQSAERYGDKYHTDKYGSKMYKVVTFSEEAEPELNKPKRGGSKKYYVYVRNPDTGNIKKVEWGDTTGLKVKINDPAARKSFAARHQCDTRNDKTKASYWACRLPRYAKSLGLQVDNPGSWW